ncbi:MAG: DNA-binding response regulator [Flavobacteriales bacterium]|nr:MAG: DNA-binding response regulator [Flavobacteriales bacterium]
MSEIQQKILLIDDEEDILEFLKYNLEKEDYHVFTATNGIDAIEIAKKEWPDLIVLDVMMPGMDGVETCTELREIPQLKDTVITFLTARSEDYSQIAGLEAGADDYITKPIKPRVFTSKIKSLLRRKNQTATTITEGLVIDLEKHLIIKDGNEIGLPKKEFELIVLLASKPGKVFGREEILNTIWGGDVVVGDRTIDVHIRKLREKLGDSYIKTIKGVGYKYEIS